jgi:hypothetical protein
LSFSIAPIGKINHPCIPCCDIIASLKQGAKIMEYTFKELGIEIKDYDGMHVSQVVPSIVNHVANKVTLSDYGHPMPSIESLYDWPATIVDFVNHKVRLIAASYEVWEAINT